MTRRAALFTIAVFLITAAAIWFLLRPRVAPVATAPMLQLTAVDFAKLPGWKTGNATAALSAFRLSCGALAKKPASAPMGGAAYAGTVGDWVDACNELSSAKNPRAFFEANFKPFAVAQSGNAEGLFTGYYEPELHASATRHDGYQTPVYGLPSDLVSVDLGKFREALKAEQISGRLEGNRLVPFATREDIDKHGLVSAPVLFYANDPIAVFFLHIQGSGRVVFDDGHKARAAYAGKNGRPYTAIGRTLIARGALTKENVSMPTIRNWLKAHPDQAAAVMRSNQSYTFFALQPDAGQNASGSQGVPLTAAASLAVDNRIHPLGVPLFLVTTLPGKPEGQVFQQLLIAQDTGGAIRGTVRGDVYWGTGARAEFLAGAMKSKGRFYVLLPNKVAASLGSGKDFAVRAP